MGYLCTSVKPNQTFNCSRCITPKRVVSLRGPSSSHCACGQHSSFRRNIETVSDMTGARFEPQTSRSRDEPVTARPTGRSQTLTKCNNLHEFKNLRENQIPNLQIWDGYLAALHFQCTESDLDSVRVLAR